MPELDAIIFGATGFTGQVVVQDAVEVFRNFKWGIAGRSEKKLKQLLQTIGEKLLVDLSSIPIVIADVNNIPSIEAMARRCRIVLNCCGPYRLYGEPVVKACIEAGTHHVDISGEPQYIDKMQLVYDSLAAKNGAYVVSTCGFESIPAEVGVNYVERNFPGTVNSIEMYWENSIDFKEKNSKALLHYGTWESFVYAFQHAGEMLSLQRKLHQSKGPELRPRLYMKPYIQKPSFGNSYFIPFPATDREVVKRSQQIVNKLENKRPVQFECYVGFRSLCVTLFMPFYMLFLGFMAQFSYTRHLLLKYPHIFSFGIQTKEGPTEANMNALYFSMIFKAKGWNKGQTLTGKPSKELLARVSGYNPFYGFTSVALLCAAKTILTQPHKMPGNGGVLPPGAAFARTNFIDELSKYKYGLKFEILE